MNKNKKKPFVFHQWNDKLKNMEILLKDMSALPVPSDEQVIEEHLEIANYVNAYEKDFG